MNALRTGLMTLFNAGGAFFDDISGRLYFVSAPDGIELPYALFFPVSDTDEDTFKDAIRNVYIQFSLFSGLSSPTEICNMDAHLTTMFNDQLFTVAGKTVVMMHRLQGSGPIYNSADVEAGTGFYWQLDVDWEFIFQ